MNLINFITAISKPAAAFSTWMDRFQQNANIRQQVMQERKELGEMGDSQLNDIGRDWVEARRESSRSYFDVPQHRLEQPGSTPTNSESSVEYGRLICQEPHSQLR